MSQSIGDRARETGGRTSGYDYIRICLALSVITVHSTAVSYGHAIDVTLWSGPQRVLVHLILPMFFSLSGFLVAGSLERCQTLVSFYGLRILRIVPALFVEVMLSALILGPICSSLEPSAYYSGPEFRSYFLNILGNIHYVLPGVFEHNPEPLKVNGQLWTVPYELQCYVALGALAIAGVTRNRRLLLGIVILGQLLWTWEAIKRGEAGALDGASGPLLILCFLVGVLFFLYRDRIVLSRSLFLGSAALCGGLSLLPHGTFYAVIPATYLTVYLGLLNPPKVPLLFSGDYSYGLYLYGFPIQQLIAWIGPPMRHWYINLPLTIILGFTIAYLSWTYIEKPALSLRRYLPKLENYLVELVRSATKARYFMPTDSLAFGIGLLSTLLLLDAHDRWGLCASAACFLLAVQAAPPQFPK